MSRRYRQRFDALKIMNNNARKIRRAALERGITALYHFTPLPNVQSILTHGLASRQVLEEHDIFYWYTDDWRADGRPDALSLSIQDINHWMFGPKLKNSRCRWAIIEISPSVLWTHDCRFCWTNAASGPVINHRGFLGGPWGFERMFEDCQLSAMDIRMRRGTFDKAPNMPTYVDAEVQVFTPIHPDQIVDVTVASDRDRVELEAWMEANSLIKPVAVYPEIFTC